MPRRSKQPRPQHASRPGSRRSLRYDPSGAALVPAKLTPAEREFIFEVAQDPILDFGAAALRAGYPTRDHGAAIMRKPAAMLALHGVLARRTERFREEISCDKIVRIWERARRVDYNEFFSIICGCCAFCWGTDHHKQYSLSEMHRAEQEHVRRQYKLPPERRTMFDGDGYERWDRSRDPMRSRAWWIAELHRRDQATLDPDDRREFAATADMVDTYGTRATALANSDHDCPECGGYGDPRGVVRDTTKLSPGARYIYQGAEITRDGAFKLNLRQRKEFDDYIGRHLGMFPTEPPVPLDPAQMSVEQLDRTLTAYGITVDVEFEDLSDNGDDGNRDAGPESDDPQMAAEVRGGEAQATEGAGG